MMKKWEDFVGKNNPNEYSIWEVRGESENCDFGGSHYMPSLGYFEGKLSDVIKYAITLPNFFTWGGGGDIRKMPNIIKIDASSIDEREKLLAKRKELEVKLQQTQEELKSLGV